MIKQAIFLLLAIFVVFTVQQGIECFLCTTIVSLGEGFITSNSTEQDVENFLENIVCGLLPSTYESLCDNFVVLNLPTLINYIMQKESPNVACTQIGACSNTTTPVVDVKPIRPLLKLSAPKSNGAIECTICTLVVNLAESILGSNASESAIENFLDNTVCGLLPTTLGQDCDALVAAYLPQLIQYIQQGEDGNVACTQIGVCPGAAQKPLLKVNPIKPLLKLSAPKSNGAIECTICTLVVNLAESILGSNASESAIENFLDNTVCGLLPTTLGQDCDALVAAYLPQLVQYIQQGEDGSVACTQIGICPGAAQKPLLKVNPIKPLLKLSAPKSNGAIECTICTAIVNLAESILGSNASESAIENFLDNVVCGLLPNSLGQDCDALVAAYLPQLIQYIQQGEDGSVACTQIGICPGVKVVEPIKIENIEPIFDFGKK